MNGLTENFSDNQLKPQRGRPRAVEPAIEALYEQLGLYDGKYSRRARVNVHYKRRALACLVFNRSDAESFKWIADSTEKARQGKIKPWRETILSELGRIENESDMRAIALQLCELKPKTKDAVDMIRRWRLRDKSKLGDVGTLTNELARCVDDYRRRYPDIQLAQVKDALNNIYCFVEDLETMSPEVKEMLREMNRRQAGIRSTDAPDAA